jgi:hypothetical protein
VRPVTKFALNLVRAPRSPWQNPYVERLIGTDDGEHYEALFATCITNGKTRSECKAHVDGCVRELGSALECTKMLKAIDAIVGGWSAPK